MRDGAMKSWHVIFLAAVLAFSCGVYAATITWVPPTPPDGATINYNYAYLNTTITNANPFSAFFDYGLAGYWSFEYYNTTHVFDNSSHSGNASYKNGLGSSDIASAKYGNGITMDGVNDYISVPDSNYLDITDKITLEAWFNPRVVNKNQFIISKASDNSGSPCWRTGYGLNIDIYSNLNLVLCNPADAVPGHAKPVSVSGRENTWNHVAATWNGTHMCLFLNGAQQGGDVGGCSLTTGLISLEASTQPLTIGSRDNTYAFFDGSIDEVRIYNRVLTPEEIRASYTSAGNRLFNNFTGLADGPHNFKAYAINDLGVMTTGSRQVTVDTGAATGISSCVSGYNINAAGTYELTGDISGDGCININVFDVTLDCKGHTITFADGGSGSGITAMDVGNVVIKNCKLQESVNTGGTSKGIEFVRVSNMKIENTTVNAFSDGSYGIYVTGMTSSSMKDVGIDAVVGLTNGLLLDGTNPNFNNFFRNISIYSDARSHITFTGDSYANRFENVTLRGQNLMQLDSWSGGTAYEPHDNFLLNITNLNRAASFNMENSANLTIQWYTRVRVTDGSSPISGAFVTYANNQTVVQGSAATGSDGYTPWLVASEMLYKGSGSNVNYNNHLVTVSKPGYETKTVEANITDNTQVDIVLSPLSTGYSRFNITALVRKNDAGKTPCIGCAVVVTFPYPGGGTATADTNSTGDFSATVEGSFTTGTYNVMVAITPPAGQTTILKREVTIS